MNLKKITLRHITVNSLKCKDKEGIGKNIKKEVTPHIQRILNKTESWFSLKYYEDSKVVGLKSPERKINQPRINEGDMKTFLNKQKLREFVTSRSALQEILKEIFQAEMKDTKK